MAAVGPLLGWGSLATPCAPRVMTRGSVYGAVVPNQDRVWKCGCICAREVFKGRGPRILNILSGVSQSLRTQNCFASFMILGFISCP